MRMFWHGVKLLWERFTTVERVKLALKWLHPSVAGRVGCPGCHASYCEGGSLLDRHLQLVKNDGCWSVLWLKLLIDCDAESDDEADKLVVFRALGIVDLV